MNEIWLLIGLIIFGGLLFLYINAIFPLVIFFKHLRTDSRYRPGFLWTLALLVLMPLSSFIYALLFSEKLSHKVFAALGSFFWVGCFGAAAWWYQQYPSMMARRQTELYSKVSTNNNSDKLRNEYQGLYRDIKTLADEQKTIQWYQLDRMVIAWDLYDLLNVYLVDTNLSRNEYADWTAKFDARDVIDERELRNFISDVKAGLAVAEVPKENQRQIASLQNNNSVQNQGQPDSKALDLKTYFATVEVLKIPLDQQYKITEYVQAHPPEFSRQDFEFKRQVQEAAFAKNFAAEEVAHRQRLAQSRPPVEAKIDYIIYLLKNDRFAEARKLAEECFQQFPEHPEIRLLNAKTIELMAQSEPDKKQDVKNDAINSHAAVLALSADALLKKEK